MQWLGRRESGNVDDRRGISGGAIAGGGGILAIIIYFVSSFLNGENIDPSRVPPINSQPQTEMTAEEKKADDERAQFVKVVLAETEDVWNKLFKEMGSQYKEPVLVLFRERVSSACGNASASVGPFYCPGDQQLYIDLSFYQDLQHQLNAPGDFAMAYVVAHEVGHHVQNLLGTADKIAQLRQQAANEAEANRLSVMMELQADFYAGVWAHYEEKYKNALDEGDIAEALNAAKQIGDDMLQRKQTGQVVPDAFTHGSSAQRMQWFKKGYDTGDLQQGNTFESL